MMKSAPTPVQRLVLVCSFESISVMPEPPLELFRRACGLSKPLSLECEAFGEPDVGPTQHHFDGPFVLIGRDPRSELVLDHPEISRRHAFFQVIAGRVFCVDLESRTKLYWEGESDPRTRGWLDQGRRLAIGPYRVRWARAEASPALESGLPDPLESRQFGAGEPSPSPLAGLVLPIRTGEEEPLWRLQSSLALVGRSGACQLTLSDDSVSRYHAVLVYTASGVWVVDLWAREGVLVNGVKIRWAWLADGDTLRIGRFTFIIRYQFPPHGISRLDAPLDAGASPSDSELPEKPVPAPISVAKSHSRGTALAARARNNASLPAPAAASFPRSSRVLVPALEQGWEPAVQFPPGQLAIWQQQMQMMESFHNDMILMVQMFVAMHREHLSSVRHELDRVQQLTRELSVLQDKLTPKPGGAEDSPGPAIAKPKETPRSSPKTRPDSPRSMVDPARQGNQTKSASRTTADGVSVPRSAPPPRSVANEPSDVGVPALDDAELHAVLTKRITELQRERQGYWQKILGAIGK
jgi:pSer/pThr/pTyr-binding forkhead associated (FHA) protein